MTYKDLRREWHIRDQIKYIEKELMVLPDYGCGPGIMREEAELRLRLKELKDELKEK